MCGSCIPAFLALHSLEGLFSFANKCLLVCVSLPPGRCAFLSRVGTLQRVCRCLGYSPGTHTRRLRLREMQVQPPGSAENHGRADSPSRTHPAGDIPCRERKIPHPFCSPSAGTAPDFAPGEGSSTCTPALVWAHLILHPTPRGVSNSPAKHKRCFIPQVCPAQSFSEVDKTLRPALAITKCM